ncbi:SRPBCC domain-containing protein [Actinotalea ferrariae]|uniref:SRPBCC domain-containing protein n=1 Tax=Actinotalea ferrariae TaxID=1386098 RepID=UPI001C8BA0E9|nr:SRPBCC domain-containing protein [Actinotalea ferrariae]MBX9245591.1 SRPBCC domain-containing protein [Actinotalea ferrariae]
MTETTAAGSPAGTTEPIEAEVRIEAPMERVWDVITQAEHVGTWFADAGGEVDLRPGGAMTLRWAEYGTYRARIDVVEPPTRLVVRWSEAPDVEPEPGNQTQIEFTLRADGDATLLRVVESGFDTLEMSAERRAEHRAGNVEGWQQELGELTRYVAGLSADAQP